MRTSRTDRYNPTDRADCAASSMSALSDDDAGSIDPNYEALLGDLRSYLNQTHPADALLAMQSFIEARLEQRSMRRLNQLSREQILAPIGDEHLKRHGPSFLGIDVGGSLSKITFFEKRAPDGAGTPESEFVKRSDRYGSTGVRDERLSFDWKDGTFHFLNFETRRMEGALEMLKRNQLLRKDEVLMATGGGAHKFSEVILTRLGLRVVKGDELHCLLWGINFLLQNTRDECYYFADPLRPLTSEKIMFDTTTTSVFPYLLVNIGSGCSILRVDSNDSFRRVSGTMMGGGTFWGLCRLLTKCTSFEEAVKLAEQGDTRKVNMRVGDIYGGAYEQYGLSAETVASAFGSIGVSDGALQAASEADIARGLLDMIAQNIAQLAYLCARKYNLTRIIFAGNFLRKNPLPMGSIAFSIDYWSQGVQKALFLRHEGYCGSTGAFFLSDDKVPDRTDGGSCTNPITPTQLHN